MDTKILGKKKLDEQVAHRTLSDRRPNSVPNKSFLDTLQVPSSRHFFGHPLPSTSSPPINAIAAQNLHFQAKILLYRDKVAVFSFLRFLISSISLICLDQWSFRTRRYALRR